MACPTLLSQGLQAAGSGTPALGCLQPPHRSSSRGAAEPQRLPCSCCTGEPEPCRRTAVPAQPSRGSETVTQHRCDTAVSCHSTAASCKTTAYLESWQLVPLILSPLGPLSSARSTCTAIVLRLQAAGPGMRAWKDVRTLPRSSSALLFSFHWIISTSSTFCLHGKK